MRGGGTGAGVTWRGGTLQPLAARQRGDGPGGCAAAVAACWRLPQACACAYCLNATFRNRLVLTDLDGLEALRLAVWACIAEAVLQDRHAGTATSANHVGHWQSHAHVAPSRRQGRDLLCITDHLNF